MQAATYRKTGLRAAVFAGLFCITAGILVTALHPGGVAQLASVVGGWFGGRETSSAAPRASTVSPDSPDMGAWDGLPEGGKKFSSGISQVIVPALKKAAAQVAATVDAVARGTPLSSYGGSYSFHQSVAIVPGGPGWVDEGGGGCCGGGGGGGQPDCHQTNSCGGGQPDCHVTNTCGGGQPDCHATNTCGGGDDCHVTNTCGGGNDCHVTNTCGGGDDCHVTNTCGGGDDCHVTNTCGGGDDCHVTNTCGGGDCHKTNTCGCKDKPNCNPHDVAEPRSMPLFAASLLILTVCFRRRRVVTQAGYGAAAKSR